MKFKSAVILTALEDEFLAVRAHLRDLREAKHPQGTRYEVGVFSVKGVECKVAVVQSGALNVNAAIETERAISFFTPSHALFVGVAGGVKDVSLGDVVVGTKVYGYQSGKAADEFLPRPDAGESAYELVQAAKRIARDRLWHPRIGVLPEPTPRAFVGPMAAGDAVVASTKSETHKFLRRAYSDALAVNMEDYGMLRAGYANPQVRCLVVRAISDLIDKKEEADSGGSQPIAAAHAAAFAFEVLADVAILDEAASKGSDVVDLKTWWDELENTVVELYPRGPEDTEIWSRAGGEISLLDLKHSGRAAWHSALKKLRQGGGGNGISIRSFVEVVREDYPRSEDLLALATNLPNV